MTKYHNRNASRRYPAQTGIMGNEKEQPPNFAPIMESFTITTDEWAII